MLVLYVLCIFATSAFAAPGINLPINAQVPPVAVIDRSFRFVFSESTFTTSQGPITYAIDNGPSWLQVDGSSRTFYGTPVSNDGETGDPGSFVVDLVATDGAGSTSMSVTFVITRDPGPGLGMPLAAQLPAFGAYSSPDTLLLTPGSALSLTFSPNSFTNTNSHTVYYALCANNTPLPSWITFDPNSLSFSGSTPQSTSPSELSQNFGIQLAASDISGFSQAVTSFRLVIESHMFAFGNSLQIINATTRSPINFTGLQHDLTLDGKPVESSDLGQIVSNAPSWLRLSNETLTLSGTAPPNARQENFTVTANDRFGDSASTVVLIRIAGHSSADLISPIPTLNASMGTDFAYSLNNSVSSAKDMNVTVDPGTASAWLNFNSTSLELYGHVPNNIKQQMFQFNVTAIQGDQSQSEIVNISVVCKDTGCPSSNSNSGNQGPEIGAGRGSISGHGGNSWIAAAVILPLAALAGLLILLCLLRRKGWTLRLEGESRKAKKITISRPIEKEKGGSLKVEAGPFSDHQRSLKEFFSNVSESPKVSWIQEQKLKRKSRFRLSKNTTLGTDESPRPDSWQSYIRKLEPSHSKYPAPAAEFSTIPEDSTVQTGSPMTGSANTSPSKSLLRHTGQNSSPTREYSQRRKRPSTMNYSGFGIFSGRSPSGLGHGRSGLSQGSSSLFFMNRGIGHGDGDAPGVTQDGPPGWGIVRKSWRNLSRLSWTSTESSPNPPGTIVEDDVERPSTEKSFASMLSSFPRPSTSNAGDKFTKPEAIPEASDETTGPTTLPQIKPPPRALSKVKTGTSFRRKNSTKNEGLQDFHKRRRQEKSQNPLFSAHLSSSRKSSMQTDPRLPDHNKEENSLQRPGTPPKQLHTRSHSQSSSLEPTSLQSSPESASPPQHKKPRTNYNFTIRALSPLRRSRSSLTSTTGSSKFSDPISMAPFYPHGALLEDTDEEGNKQWRHPNHPNPLGTNRTHLGNIANVSDSELIDSLRAAGQFSAAQRLDYLRAQTEGRAGGGEHCCRGAQY
ncbi:hypothetical protein ACLMJK_007287 [Lecanora helva]